MENKTNTVKCPKCGQSINVQALLSHQMQEEFKAKYNIQLIEINTQYKKKLSEVKILQESVEAEKSNINDIIQKSVQKKVEGKKLEIEKAIRQRIDEEKSDEILSYKTQLEEKISEAKEFNKLKAEYQRLNREKNEMKEKLEAESEQKFSKKLEEEKTKIKKDTQTKSELKIAEKEMVIQQLNDQLKIAQRKAEQGSMQVQGEVAEIAIENFLKASFPTDTISEIKKGIHGADCMQIINTLSHLNCGSIYYECKRAQDFQKSWIEKFKKDMRQTQALFGVLVTECYPKGMERMGQQNGIWICSFEEFKGLCFVIREAVILLHDVAATQEGKGTKMELLYSFLTGNEFKMHVEAIVEGFSQLQEDLLKEKRAMDNIWKQREKQIQKVLLNTSQMYGSIKGIAGRAIGSIKLLELTNED